MIIKKVKKLLQFTMALAFFAVLTSGGTAFAEEKQPVAITDPSCFDTAYIDGMYTVTAFHQPQGPTVNTIVIPAGINGQRVRAIGPNFFAEGADVHELYLPDTLERIGSEAFNGRKVDQIGSYTYETVGGEFSVVETASAESAFIETPTIETNSVCTSLGQLPSELKTIGEKAFYHSTVADIVIRSQGLTIEPYAFSGIARLNSITVDEGATVTEIGEAAFQNCGNFHDFWVNGTVNTIRKSAFEGCGNMNNLVVGTNGCIAVIEEKAFQNCANLHTVTLRGALTSIGNLAFQNCGNMNDLVIESTTPYTIGEYAFQNNANLHNVTLSEGITTIEKGTFENCQNMNKVTLPNSLQNIKEDAFKNLPNLHEITIGENTVISPDAFAGAGEETKKALAQTNNPSAKAIAGVPSTPQPTPSTGNTPVVPVFTSSTPAPAPTVSAVKLKKAKVNKKKKKVTLTWSKNKKASGYTIYKKVVKKGTKAKKAKKIKFKKVKNVKAKTTKLTLKLAKRSTTTFYVKAFQKVTVNGKTTTYYSKASNKKKAVLK